MFINNITNSTLIMTNRIILFIFIIEWLFRYFTTLRWCVMSSTCCTIPKYHKNTFLLPMTMIMIIDSTFCISSMRWWWWMMVMMMMIMWSTKWIILLLLYDLYEWWWWLWDKLLGINMQFKGRIILASIMSVMSWPWSTSIRSHFYHVSFTRQ